MPLGLDIGEPTKLSGQVYMAFATRMGEFAIGDIVHGSRFTNDFISEIQSKWRTYFPQDIVMMKAMSKYAEQRISLEENIVLEYYKDQ